MFPTINNLQLNSSKTTSFNNFAQDQFLDLTDNKVTLLSDKLSDEPFNPNTIELKPPAAFSLAPLTTLESSQASSPSSNKIYLEKKRKSSSISEENTRIQEAVAKLQKKRKLSKTAESSDNKQSTTAHRTPAK